MKTEALKKSETLLADATKRRMNAVKKIGKRLKHVKENIESEKEYKEFLVGVGYDIGSADLLIKSYERLER